MYWSARPFVRIVLIYIAGVYSYFTIGILQSVPDYIFIVIFSLFLVTTAFLVKKKFDIKYNPYKGFVFGALIFTLALLISSLNFPEFKKIKPGMKGVFLGNVISNPVETENTVKVVVRIKKLNDSLLENDFKAMVYLRKRNDNKIFYGDDILFYAFLKEPEGPKNPEEFDYKRFLRYKGIDRIAYAGKYDYKILGSSPGNYLKYIAFKLRDKLLKSLQENGIEGKEFAVAAAVILGYDDVMDDDIRMNYKNAGAMHVLCVSGLHVGIVYLVLNFLLGFLKKTRLQRLIKVTVLLVAVWFYAFLTGLSPSVLRATVMISFFIIGNEVQRDKDAYNTLAMSAFFLLVINPALLFDVGFQLSYAAVLGIITFYNPVYRLFWVKNNILDKLWSVTAVSLAAQLGAFPIAVHYFNTFPVYFLLTNLIVFPFSFLIITGGLLFMMVSWIAPVAKIVALLLSGMIYLMNYLVEFVSHLSGSVIKDLYFPWIKVFIIYSIMVSVYIFLSGENKRSVFAVLISILALLIFQTFHKFNNLTQKDIVFYDTGKAGNTVDFINGKNHLLITDAGKISDIEYFTDKFRIKKGLDKNYLKFDTTYKKPNQGVFISNDFISFEKMRIVKPEKKFYKTGNKPEVDKLWITDKTKQSLTELSEILDFKEVILGSGINEYYLKKYKRELENQNIPFYDISENGCLIIDLNNGKSTD